MKTLPVVVVTAVLLTAGMTMLLWPRAPTVNVTPDTARIMTLLDAFETTHEEPADPARPRPPVFPEDHGAHLGQAMETWQFAGQAAAENDRPFRFRLSLYRLRLVPADAPPRDSPWATRHVYWAQLSITDARGTGFHFFERYTRDGPALAGVEGSPPRIFVENWRVDLPGSPTGRSGFHLQAGEGSTSLDLALQPLTAAVPVNRNELSGDGGRSPFQGYRMARLRVSGTLLIGKESHTVTGSAWLEHAWGDIPLPVGPVVWNRFTLQLRDGTEVAVLQLRRRDGSRPPSASLLLVAPGGETLTIADRDLSLEATGQWKSPVDDTAYPSGWRLQVPSADMVLHLRPTLPDQEVFGALRHWSGSVEVSGRRRSRPVDGWGYVDLFGYGAPDDSSG